MEFRNWIEAKWHEFGDTVHLFHGTSSAFEHIIKTEGLKPPNENIEEYALGIAAQYGPVSPQLIDFIKKNVLTARKDTPLHKTSNVLYLVASKKNAVGYAHSYAKHGGEIGYEIWRFLNDQEMEKKLGPRPRRAYGDHTFVKPIYPDGRPIIVEVEIPFKWMKTFVDLPELYKRIVKYWEREKDENGVFHGIYGKYTNFNDYIENEVTGFEIRVAETIPPNMVKNIHYL